MNRPSGRRRKLEPVAGRQIAPVEPVALALPAERKARGYGRFRTIRMVIFLIAGKLDFSTINPYVAA